MAKLFSIMLSEPGKKVSVPYSMLNPKSGKVEEFEQESDARKEEKDMLIALFGIASNHQTTFAASMECLDCVGQIKGLGEGNSSIELTKSDIDYLSSAWEKSAGRRNAIWNELTALMAQLANPQEKKAAPKEEPKPEEKAE
jgi:hypothetical protein